MRILIATDFSAQADNARVLVAGLDLPSGSDIRIVHSIEPLPDVAAMVPSALLDVAEAAIREAEGELERIAGTLRVPGRDVTTTVSVGRASDVIIDEAERFAPDLIVIGSRGRGGIASAVLGSVSAEVVDRARWPVLVARRSTLTRIVLADDGSTSAATGAELITQLPILSRLPVCVVSVVDAPFPYMLTGGDSPMTTYGAIGDYYDSLPALRDAHDKIARGRTEMLERAGVNATYKVREGDAAAQLIDAAEATRADCVVIGSRGQTGVSRFVIGSVARGVLFHTGCSVLVTKLSAVATTYEAASDLVVARR